MSYTRQPVFGVKCSDCLSFLREQPPASVDLVFGSPPYEDVRTYGIGVRIRGQDWVDWMVEVYRESLRVCRGLAAFVVEGRTRAYRWSATPALLMADLHRAGVHLRKPPAYVRHGIPGSGRTDWLKNRYEFIICATNGGKLPWSENNAMGGPPKCAIGGPPSYRRKDGSRINESKTWGRVTSGMKNGDTSYRKRASILPDRCNPGNVIDCGAAGGGHLGSKIAHENEAPFPEKLAEFFVRSFCPPGGVVCDPFSGSGTTAAVALRYGRGFVGCDVRESQVELTLRRVDAA